MVWLTDSPLAFFNTYFFLFSMTITGYLQIMTNYASVCLLGMNYIIQQQ